MASYFWVSGSGTWDNATNTHWASSTGGAGGAGVPTSADDVTFDTNSAASVVTLGTSPACKNLSCVSAFTGRFAGSGSLTVAGNLTFVSGMGTNTATGNWTFTATDAGHTITSAGNKCGGITCNGVGGVWTLQDALDLTPSGSGKALSVNNGTFNSNGKAITCGQLSSNTNAVRGITLDSSTVTFSGGTATCFQFGSASPNLTWSAVGTVWNLPTTAANAYSFNLGGLSLNLGAKIACTGNGSGTIGFSFGALTVTTLDLSALAANNRSLLFATNQTHTLTSILTPPVLVITIKSDTAGVQTTLVAASGPVTVTRCKVQDCNGSPAFSWLAQGLPGADLGNNTGWLFSSRAVATARNLAAVRSRVTTARALATARSLVAV